nr:Hpt domain-containing protein [Pontibacterium sinense]
MIVDDLTFIRTDRLLTLYSGDEVQVRRCIKVFCQSFNNWESLYSEACKRKDSASARNLAHRLKGAAANIGDVSLAERARQLETNHRENQWSGHDSLLYLFSEHLTQLNEALHDYEESTHKTASACVNRDSALQTLSDLKQSLLKHQLIDDDLIENIRTLLHLNSVKEQAEQLLLSLNVFDYPSAQQQCDNIIRELKNDF